MNRETYAVTRDEHNGNPIYTNVETGVVIRKVVRRGLPEYAIYVPGQEGSVDGAFLLRDAKPKADGFVRRIREAKANG